MRTERPNREDGRGRRHHEGEERRERRGGAKTFRRARALSFLERLETKREALKKQLETPELQSIHPIIVGELKAIEMMIAEFVDVFELQQQDEQ